MSGRKSFHHSDSTTRRDDSGYSAEGRTLFLRTCVPLAIAWAVEMFSRVAYTTGLMDGTQRDVGGMVATVLLLVSSFYLLFLLRKDALLRLMLAAALVLLVIAQLSDVVDEFEAVQSYALLARRHPVHLLVEHCIFISGCMLLMATAKS
jgi:hypothetical protein